MEALKYAVICVDDDPIILQLIDFQMKKLVNDQTTIVETTTNPREVEAKIEEIRFAGKNNPGSIKIDTKYFPKITFGSGNDSSIEEVIFSINDRKITID